MLQLVKEKNAFSNDWKQIKDELVRKIQDLKEDVEKKKNQRYQVTKIAL